MTDDSLIQSISNRLQQSVIKCAEHSENQQNIQQKYKYLLAANIVVEEEKAEHNSGDFHSANDLLKSADAPKKSLLDSIDQTPSPKITFSNQKILNSLEMPNLAKLKSEMDNQLFLKDQIKVLINENYALKDKIIHYTKEIKGIYTLMSGLVKKSSIYGKDRSLEKNMASIEQIAELIRQDQMDADQYIREKKAERETLVKQNLEREISDRQQFLEKSKSMITELDDLKKQVKQLESVIAEQKNQLQLCKQQYEDKCNEYYQKVQQFEEQGLQMKAINERLQQKIAELNMLDADAKRQASQFEIEKIKWSKESEIKFRYFEKDKEIIVSEYEEKLTRQEEDLRKVIAEKLSEIGALKSKINQEQIQFQQEIVKLQVQMNNAISNAKSLEKQNSDLLAEKIMHKEQKENIEAEYHDLELEMQELKSQISDLTAKHDKLMNQNGEMIAEIHQMTCEFAKNNEEFQKKYKMQEDTHKHELKEKLHEQELSYMIEIQQIKRDMDDEIEHLVSEKKEQHFQFDKQQKEQQNQVSQIELRMEILKEEHQNNLSEAQQKFLKFESETEARITQMVKAHKKECEGLNRQIYTLSIELEEERSKHNALKIETKNLKQSLLADKDEEVQKQKNAAEEQIQLLNQEQHKKISQLQSEIKILQQYKDQTYQREKNLSVFYQTQIDQLKSAQKESQAVIENHTADTQSIIEQKNEALQDMKKMEEKYAALTKEYNAYQDAANQNISKLQKQIQVQNQKWVNLNNETSYQNQVNDKLIAELKQTISEMEKKKSLELAQLRSELLMQSQSLIEKERKIHEDQLESLRKLSQQEINSKQIQNKLEFENMKNKFEKLVSQQSERINKLTERQKYKETLTWATKCISTDEVHVFGLDEFQEKVTEIRKKLEREYETKFDQLIQAKQQELETKLKEQALDEQEKFNVQVKDIQDQSEKVRYKLKQDCEFELIEYGKKLIKLQNDMEALIRTNDEQRKWINQRKEMTQEKIIEKKVEETKQEMTQQITTLQQQVEETGKSANKFIEQIQKLEAENQQIKQEHHEAIQVVQQQTQDRQGDLAKELEEELEKEIREHQEFSQKHYQEFQEFINTTNQRYRALEGQYKELLSEYQCRPSRKEDLNMMKQLRKIIGQEQKIARKCEEEKKQLELQKKYLELELQNQKQLFSVFGNNSLHKQYNKLIEEQLLSLSMTTPQNAQPQEPQNKVPEAQAFITAHSPDATEHQLQSNPSSTEILSGFLQNMKEKDQHIQTSLKCTEESPRFKQGVGTEPRAGTQPAPKQREQQQQKSLNSLHHSKQLVISQVKSQNDILAKIGANDAAGCGDAEMCSPNQMQVIQSYSAAQNIKQDTTNIPINPSSKMMQVTVKDIMPAPFESDTAGEGPKKDNFMGLSCVKALPPSEDLTRKQGLSSLENAHVKFSNKEIQSNIRQSQHTFESLKIIKQKNREAIMKSILSCSSNQRVKTEADEQAETPYTRYLFESGDQTFKLPGDSLQARNLKSEGSKRSRSLNKQRPVCLARKAKSPSVKVQQLLPNPRDKAITTYLQNEVDKDVLQDQNYFKPLKQRHNEYYNKQFASALIDSSNQQKLYKILRKSQIQNQQKVFSTTITNFQ